MRPPSFKRAALTALVAEMWAGSMLGTTGSTYGSFTSNTTNSATFISDAPLPAPLVTAITPADSATRVPAASRVIVTFSESMDAALTQKAVLVQQVSGGSCSPANPCAVPGTFSWPRPSMLEFIPAGLLAVPFTTFQVTVTKGAVGSPGNGSIALNTPVASTFTTGDGTEKVPPPVIVLSAPNDVAPPKTAIQVTFSEQMDAASAQAAFLLQQTSGAYKGAVCSVDAPCTVPTASGGFGWGGPAGTILSYAPSPDLTGANYRVTEQATAQSLYGVGLSQGSPPSNTFSFVISGAPSGPPGAPVITSPTTAVWVGVSTFTISGTTNQPNLLIEALDEDGHLAASLQLDGGSTTFSLPVPVAEGLNKFTIMAVNAFYHSINNPVVTVNRDDRTTTLDAWSVIPDVDQIDLKVPYHGDANNNSYATFACNTGTSAGAACSGSPTAKVPGANGQFAYSFAGLKLSTAYAVQVDVFDSDQVTCVAPWTPVSPTHCTQSLTLTTTARLPQGGAIISLVVTPNDGTPSSKTGLVASAAPQKQAFNLVYNCGVACTTFSSVLLSLSDSSAKRINTICGKSGAVNARLGNAALVWDGKDSSGALAADGVYAYTLKVFDDGACGATPGANYVAAHSGDVVKVSNANLVAVTSPVTNLTPGAPLEIDAKLQNYAGVNVADGDAGVDPGTEASLTLTAVGAITNSGLRFTGGSAVNGIPRITTRVGESGPGCPAVAGAGQACAQLGLAATASVAQYVTITATSSSQGAKSSVSGQLVIANPPLPPTGVTLTPGSINVSWTPSLTQNVAGYRILLGKAPGQYDRTIDAGNVTSYHIVDVDSSATYYVQVQSYTADGLASPLPSVPGANDSAINLAAVTVTATATPSRTVTPTAVGTSVGACDATATSTPTGGSPTPACTPTATITPTATSSVTPSATATTTATALASATAASASPTVVASASATSTPVGAPSPTATSTSAPAATSTPAPTTTALPTSTPTRSPTATRTSTPTATPTH